MKEFLLALYKKFNLSKSVQLFIQRILNDQFLIGVAGVIFNDKKEVLLFKHSYRQVEWSIPGGYLKAKEHPKEGLEREIKEESGFSVCLYKILSSTHDDDDARLELCYYGRFIGGEFKPSAEVTEYGFFSREKLPPLMKDQYKLIDEAYKKYKPSMWEDFKYSVFKKVSVFRS